MNATPDKYKFWAGNAILALDMLLLFFMQPASEALGFGAVILWMALAALGVWLIMKGRQDAPPLD
mgnify:CR=1 FL=1